MKRVPRKKLEITPEFKHKGFPILLLHLDGKELTDVKYCYFSCQDHAQKYIKRHNLKKENCKIYINK
jgi:hypothetical protein